MDSQAFGACQCCTQATFLARDVEEARFLTDQFLVLAPLFLALTAATPFLRGLVADTDTRWQTFQQCWDDRSREELAMVRNSRTSPCDLYIGADLQEGADAGLEVVLNDVAVSVHEPAQKTLQEAGVDALMSRHVAHLLVRDPLMVFEDKLGIDDQEAADHWEQLQGTNWGNVRFKPPPAGGSIGWRVEFRSPEVQLTDYENAAIVAVIRVLAEIIVEQRWDLRIPVSKCDENDLTSSERDAASQGLFWFRDLADGAERSAVSKRPLADILSGDHGVFTRCHAWLQQKFQDGLCSASTLATLRNYMSLFARRATGELPTPAGFLRAWLRGHSAYAGDGVVPPAFVRELCVFAADVNAEGRWPADLLGEIVS